MEELKDKLNQKPSEWPNSQPLPGHRERFENKLLINRSNRFFGPGNPFWMYAAAAVLLVLIGTFAWTWNRENIEDQTTEQAGNSQKFAAMEHYFNAKIKDDGDLRSSEDSLVQFYLLDLKKLELQQEQLEAKLELNYGNEKIINAIIENYKMRLSIMERLRRYIKIKNQRNEKQAQEFESI